MSEPVESRPRSHRPSPQISRGGLTDKDDKVRAPTSQPEGAATRLLAAATISALGDGMRTSLLPLFATAQDGVSGAGVVLAAGYLPWLIFGLLAGAVADRVNRAKAMIVVDSVRAFAMTAFAVSLVAGTPPLAVTALLAFALGSAETLFDNAAVALLPNVASADRLPSLNARMYTAQTMGVSLIGPALGGLLYTFGPSIPMFLDAASFLLAAILVRPLLAHRSPSSDAGAQVWAGVRHETVVGLSWLMRHRSMRALTVLYAVLGCVSGTLLAVLPTYAHDRLGLGGSGYGLLLSCFGLGTLSGGMTAGSTVRAFRAGRTLVVCAGTTTLVFVGLAFSSQLLEAALCMVLLGVVVATWTVVTVTLRQRLVPNGILGRVASAFRVSGLALTVVGASVAGPAVAYLGLKGTLEGAAFAVAACALVSAPSVAPLSIDAQPDTGGLTTAEG